MLLVGDDQVQVVENGGVGQEGMGADDQVRFAGGDGVTERLLLLGGQTAGEQADTNAQRGKKL